MQSRADFGNAFRILLLGLLVAPVAAPGRDLLGSPEDYLQLLRQLKPGDRLLLRAGQYVSGLPVHGINGVAGNPIVVSGPAEPPPGDVPAKFR